jgi:nucleotide-binding universal stress UspA family protein
MAMRILAVLPQAHGARACLDAALAASLVDAASRIEAFHVKVDPRHLTSSPEEIALQHMREHDEGTSEERAQKVRDVFAAWSAGLDDEDRERVTWREVVGPEEKLLLKEAKSADLLVLTRPGNIDAKDAMHTAIFEARLPLLVPPDWVKGERRTLGERIAIAWRPSDQARRAVTAARPWLRRARSVVILAVADENDDSGIDEAERMVADLGVQAETKVLPITAKDPGETLLTAVADAGADVLVMGAYHHDEWIEWALGGTTKYILANAHVPLLLSH